MIFDCWVYIVFVTLIVGGVVIFSYLAYVITGDYYNHNQKNELGETPDEELKRIKKEMGQNFHKTLNITGRKK